MDVQGMVLLLAVHGVFTLNTQALVDKIVFESHLAVVIVPDLF